MRDTERLSSFEKNPRAALRVCSNESIDRFNHCFGGGVRVTTLPVFGGTLIFKDLFNHTITYGVLHI